MREPTILVALRLPESMLKLIDEYVQAAEFDRERRAHPQRLPTSSRSAMIRIMLTRQLAETDSTTRALTMGLPQCPISKPRHPKT